MLVFGQPIIELRTRTHAASELLVRMQSAGERAEILAPARFLPTAERFGVIQPIDIWMVRQATMLPEPSVLQVNLSAVTLSDAAARREIVELLAAAPEAARGSSSRSPRPPRRLTSTRPWRSPTRSGASAAGWRSTTSVPASARSPICASCR